MMTQYTESLENDLYHLGEYQKKLSAALSELSASAGFAARAGKNTKRLERIISLLQLEQRTVRDLQQQAGYLVRLAI